MIIKTLREIAALAGGTLHDESKGDVSVRGVSTDTRTLREGNLFVPLIGSTYNGHEFLAFALEKKASAAFWAKDRPLPDANIPLVLVDDTTAAYQLLAKQYRMSLDVTVVGITGSNGKTTTKDILAAVLGTAGPVVKTIGNLNNHIGVPKTLLDMDETTRFAVVEMGTERPGEIALLSDLARPDVAILTNIGDVHLEELLSRENIAKEKLDIRKGMPSDGILLYNGDDETLKAVVDPASISQKTITFGLSEDCDVVAVSECSNSRGNFFSVDGISYRLPLLGNYQIYNGVAAVALGYAFNLTSDDIAEGFMQIDATGMRNELINCKGFDILNDAYKSNPQSLLEAFETMNLLSGYTRKIAVVGDMLGLGDAEREIHRDVGRKISPHQIDYLLTIGRLTDSLVEGASENFPPHRVFHFDSVNPLIEEAKNLICKSSLVLVKASRAMALETVVEELKQITVL